MLHLLYLGAACPQQLEGRLKMYARAFLGVQVLSAIDNHPVIQVVEVFPDALLYHHYLLYRHRETILAE